MNSSHGMPEPQRLRVEVMKRTGYVVEKVQPKAVRVRRGNDVQLVLLDGSNKRAIGGEKHGF